MNLSFLYRGTLSSCNYDCPYCPFAKHWESPEELASDRAGLDRFVEWIAGRTDDEIAILFTPWGEALVRKWYREAVTFLSNLPHVRRVAVQTNLSVDPRWLADADPATAALWCTYHPGQAGSPGRAGRAAFLRRCRTLDDLGVRYSVGVVGRREHLAEIETLRTELRPGVYLWVNAEKDEPGHDAADLVEALTRIDPLFPTNLADHPSRGRACRTGWDVFTVDAAGDVRRCHFVDRVIGNLHDGTFPAGRSGAPCPNATCGCHIGYVHLEPLGLHEIFGDGLLERIPAGWPNR
ncbi:STM4011 family radical SAM protein [Alienimonas californiensis]|uniref:Radical SAM superfamily protein n=1 Tax=Alienimonas californiensis TaxID=2527989 RepID=A0A517P4C6_9PLAN|nr:STM4011 family radical SAM protein [Alienimonas californiensis]QDT14230.1 hypothetical protein CA12_02990 [Alienimonas californiensis]